MFVKAQGGGQRLLADMSAKNVFLNGSSQCGKKRMKRKNILESEPWTTFQDWRLRTSSELGNQLQVGFNIIMRTTRGVYMEKQRREGRKNYNSFHMKLKNTEMMHCHTGFSTLDILLTLGKLQLLRDHSNKCEGLGFDPSTLTHLTSNQ